MTTDEQTATEVRASADSAKPAQKARAAPRRAHVGTKKGKSAKNASSPKKTPKGRKKASGARDGSTTAKVLELLKRLDGATAKELLKVTGWQAHSLRGFLSGTVGKKMGLTVTSTKGDDGERSYSVRT